MDDACLAALRELLPAGADVDGLDGDGRSALWHAADRGLLGVAIHLGEQLGASRTLADNGGRTPLWIAALEGHLAVVQWLAGHGGSVAQPANSGATPLYVAALKGHLAVVQWLAGHGGSVAQPANNGATPLAAARHFGYDRVAAFLDAASSWPAFQILVACRLAGDAKRALRAGRLDPCAGPTSLAELVAVCASPKDVLWDGSPDVCQATSRLVRDAVGPWTPSRHFLFHAGVRSSIRVVLLSGIRVRARCDVPMELWEAIFGLLRRSDWEVPVAQPRGALAAARPAPGTGWLCPAFLPTAGFAAAVAAVAAAAAIHGYT